MFVKLYLNSQPFNNTNIKIPKFFFTVYNTLKLILKDNAFKYTFLAITFKIILFFTIIVDDNASKISFKIVFYSIPPILVYVSFLCIFLSFAYIFKGQVRLFSFLILDVLLTIILIGDLWYFRSNRSFLTFHMIKYTANLNNLSDSIFAMFRPIDILFLFDIVILLVYFLKIRNEYKTLNRNSTCFFILFFIPIMYLTYAHYKIDINKKCFSNQHVFYTAWEQNETMFNLTPIGYHIYDGYTYYKDSKKHELTDKEKKEISTWFKDKAEILPDNKYKGMFKGKNLIIIQVESLENFVINKSVDGEEITPNLNKLIKNGIYFKNIKEQTYNGTTSDGELLCNTSMFPVRRGSTFFRYPNNTYSSSLPELLEGIGYNTLAIHPDRGSYWNWLPSLKSIGFNTCIDSSSFNIDEKIGLGLSDGSFFRQFVPILSKEKKPFFSFSITLTSHAPFNLPDKHKSINIPSELKGNPLGRYFESIHYTDEAIGNFIDELDKASILDNSIVVFYGDHEGPHRFFKDQVASMRNIPKWMQVNNQNIPLIVYSKNSKNEVVDTYGGQVDIMPTISYLMGVDSNKYTYTSMGRNLLNTKRNFVILPNGNIHSINLSKKEINMFRKAVKYSDKLIEANHFRKEP